MKALVMRAQGDLSQLAVQEVPRPEVLNPRDVLIRIKAAALNHLDLWTLRGLPGLALRFPHILGGDGAGLVAEVGPGVSRVARGDKVLFNPGISCYRCDFCLAGEQSLCERFRILGEHLAGTLAEYVAVPEQNLAVIPTPPAPHPEITWYEAAAFSLSTITVWRMLMTRARLRPGEVVLVWGVGGGVGSSALKIAKLAGASVIVTSSSDAKLRIAKSLGADATINYNEAEVVKEVRSLTGKSRGVDVVVESVGEATWEKSMRVLAPGGRVVTCGGTSGHRLLTDVRPLFWYHWTILGSTMGNAREYREIVRLLGQGKLRPIIDSVHPLDDGVEAFRRLQSGGQMGKVVVEM
jgi:NADPH:quinone reductase-like Zn-dependent oxidoreductase